MTKNEELTGNRKINANVLCYYPSKRYVVAFDTFDKDYNITTLFELPCASKEQAWSTADAFNHPESNSNNWRESF
jgi:hypothetical protein